MEEHLMPPRPTLLRIMSNDLDLNAHIVLAEAGDTDAGPEGLVVGHVLAEVADHGGQRLVVDRHVVRVHPEHLRPPLPARRPQRQLHVRERLVDLRVDLSVELPRRRVPSAWFSVSERSLFGCSA